MDHGKAIAAGTPNELKAMIQNKETVQVEIPKLDEEQRGILASTRMKIRFLNCALMEEMQI